ncbi:MAG: fibronectin type III domain-containing protein [Gammaproteobacteria bacterium]
MTAFLAAFLAASPAQAQSGTLPQNEAQLHSFGAPAGVLSPQFEPRRVRYNLSLAGMPVAVTFTPVPSVAGAAVTVNGAAITAESPSLVVPLGDQAVIAVTFVVTALDRVTTRIYTLRMFRPVPLVPPVFTLSAQSYARILIVWESDHAAHPPVTQRYVRFRVKNPQGNWQGSGGRDAPDGERVFRSRNWDIFSVTADTEYEVQMRATNATGGSDWSDLQSVTSMVDSPSLPLLPPRPLLLASRDRSLIATWQSQPHSAGYFVRWREAAGGAKWQAASGDDDNGQFIQGAGAGGYVIPGLTNETEYTVQVAAAETFAAEIFFGAEVRAIPTNRASPPSAPPPNNGETGVYVACHGSGICSVRWDPPNDDGGGEITGYRIRWRIAAGGRSSSPTPAGAWNVENGVASNGNTLVHAITFTEIVQFEAQVAAVNSAGRSAWTVSNTSASRIAAASANASDFRSLTVTDAGGNPIALTPPFAGSIRVYQATVGKDVNAITVDTVHNATTAVFYRGSGNTPNAVAFVPATIRIAPGVNSIRLEGRVLGSQDLAVYLLTLTRPAPPGQPAPPNVATASETSLDVSWLAPPPGSQPLSGYRVRWRTSAASNRAASNWRDESGNNDAGHEIADAAITDYIVSNLHEGISYDVQVRGLSQIGPGAWSDAGDAIAASRNANLASLTFSAAGPVLLLPAFNAESLTYQAYFARAERTVGVQAQSAHSVASITIDGRELPRNAAIEVPLVQNGVKRINVVVNAADQNTSRVYVVAANHLPAPPRMLLLSASRANSAPAITARWQPGITSYANAAAGIHIKRADTTEWPSDERGANSLPAGVTLTAGIAPENGVFSATLAGVAAGTAYDVRVAGAYTADGLILIGPFSETARVTSGAQVVPPGVPQNLRVIAGDGELSLRWSPPAETGGGTLSYRARWSQGYASTDWDNLEGTSLDGDSSAMITSLTGGKIYAVQIAAANSAGRGDFSESGHGLAGTFNLEVSFNGGAPDWVDGVLIGRYLLGLRGDALLMPALTGVTVDAAQIAAKIDAGITGESLDVDDNGAVNAADGIMVARYLFGVRGAALLDGQADSSGSAVAEVEGRINALIPSP